MTISNLKDLKRLIKLLRETGVHTATVDGISLQLGSLPQKQREINLPSDPIANISVPTPNIEDPIAAAKAHAAKELAKIQDFIDTPDEMSDEQKMFYSARQEAGHEQ